MVKKKIIHHVRRLKNSQRRRQVSRYIETHNVGIGVVSVVVIALVLTSINMALYVFTGTSKLDLSRPGYESVRKEVSNEDKLDEARSFSSGGKLDRKALDEYLSSYRKKQQTLGRYDKFDSRALDNSQLNLPGSSEPVQATSNE